MERDPVRLAWTTSPARYAAAVVLLLAAGLLLLAGFDLVRVLVDQVIGAAAVEPFGRLRLVLPERLGIEPITLLPGIPLERPALASAVLASLATLPVLVGLCLVGVDWLAAGIGAEALARVRRAILAALLGSPAAARDENAATAALAGDSLARESAVIGSAALAPVQAGGVVVTAFLFTLLADWRLALALTVMLALCAVAMNRRLDTRVGAVRARRIEGQAIEQSLGDLLRRLPALRAHGTGDYERDRLSRALVQQHGPVEAQERRLAAVDALAAAALLLTPLAVLGTGAWFAAERGLTIGTILAASLAAALAGSAIRELAQWRRLVDQVRPLLQEAARMVAHLQTRERREAAASLPRAGTLVAQGLSAYDPASGARVTGIDLNLPFPAHVALVGDGDAGPRILAALIGGLVEPSTGRLTYGGIDLNAVDPAERARRIAFAGGETVLIPGTLRDNLIYGCAPNEPYLDDRLSEAVTAAGLDRLIHARGLAGTLDPAREPKLAAAIVDSRRAVQAALAQEGLDRYVDPFDASRYNHHATIGENMLFGKPIGDTFREDNLASHPFVRAILEAEELTKPLAAVGLSIATSMIEIFAEIPDGHPLFERFSFFSGSDRPYFEDLVERRAERRRGADSARDRERLIGLALRYSESRHRLGLMDDALRARLLAARADFAKMLPVSLKPSIEFYDEGRLCTAASVQDNLLFGRIAADQAGAEAAVHGVIRRVLTERGLDGDVSRIGLLSPVDIRGDDLTVSEIAAIDLVRCLVRRPDIVVVERALDGLPGPAADALVARLRRALVGRGLVLVTSEVSPGMDRPPLDAVIRFERGLANLDDRRLRQPETAVA
ncbi:MAG TPA: ABC transporter ATP-binding protein [Microvirga sp.]